MVGSGTSYAPGADYVNDPNEPYYVHDTGTNISKIFRYYQSGSTWVYDTNAGVGYGTINPSQYSNNGTLATVGAGNWSIQRVFYFPSSVTKAIVVYYGNAIYPTEAEALTNLAFESFIEAPNTAANAIYLGAIIVNGNGVFTNANTFTIYPSGLFRQVGGSGGGGSTITTTLSGLSDVNITSPTQGQGFAYDATQLKWVNTSSMNVSITGNAATATTASYVTLAQTASYVVTAQTASYVLNAVSASFATTATTASYVLQAVSASFATLAQTANTASYVVTSQTASYVLQAVSASFATTASYSNTSTSASYANNATTAQTASYILNAVSASFAATASYVNQLNQVVYVGNDIQLDNQFGGIVATSFNAGMGTIAINDTPSIIDINSSTIVLDGNTGEINAVTFNGNLNGTSSYATQALSSSFAVTASYVQTAQTASYVLQAVSASFATLAQTSNTASYVVTAQTASYVLNAVSASYATQALSASYAPSTPTFPYTGSAIISGSLTVTGSLYITGSATLINEGPTVLSGSFKVQGAGNGFVGSFAAIEIDDVNFSRKLFDFDTGSGSLDFSARQLLDRYGTTAIEWTGTSGTYISNLYGAHRISSGVRDKLYTNNDYSGQILLDVYFDINVQDNDLVYLGNSGEWAPAEQNNAAATKMLGIAKEIFNQTGSVLIEGDLVVTTTGGYPIVSNAGYGSPVYMKQGTGTQMDTTIPVNGYVRLLGYCYASYNAGNDWIMKFRPSNEWVEL